MRLTVEPPTIVVDASVLVDALMMPDPDGERVRDALRDHRLAGPEHLMVETFNAIRGQVLGGKVTVDEAKEAVDELGYTAVELVPTTLLLERMWELRNNVSGYDAAYVAAAEHLGVPLVTTDKRLTTVQSIRCEVRIPY